MSNEETFDNEFIEENEIKTDKSKKIFIILIILILFGGMYYYYYKIKKQNEFSLQPAVNTISTVNNNKIPEKSLKIVKKPEISKNTTNLSNKSDQIPIKKEIDAAVIKPTNKENITRLAMIDSGKSDPFSDLNKKTLWQRPGNTAYIKQNYLPLPPASMRGLPAIGKLPELSIPNSKNLPNMVQIPEPVAIKGFIGNKVIVDINGITQSLSVNESFQDIKVLQVNPGGLSARFKRNGEIITKTVRDLTAETINNKDLKLVKNLSK